MLRALILMLTVSLLPLAAQATDPASPVGRWRTIDDDTKSERSIVEVTKVGDELQGRVLRIFYRPDEKPDPVCDLCEGARKDQPVIGMTFLWGLKPDGGNDWAGGAILDPKNGKIYNAKLSLTEAGSQLRVRGYIGTPLLGRTQTWHREKE
ncbi:DUF2147 domain-containing protein [Ferrovibrio sp.]|uniref:DUF2147 domain-containing protein n=1 Tax=Ferrovibrio sp. TaxID=1917215 RepID=UPI001B6B5C30|nr:DUF2147 domain-containing protein [Ferrovibrio sp.]MBP7065997.1 DUF2147 domain-containing protein [Ferrovibrio sp.]